MFRAIPLSIIRSFSMYTQRVVYVTQVCCVYSEKLLMMDRGTARNMQFYSKNKFEKLVHLVGFIIRIVYNSFKLWIISMLQFYKTHVALSDQLHTVIPRLTKIIRSGITFVSRNFRQPKRDFPQVSIENRLIRSGCCPLFKDKFYKIVKSTL